MPDDAKGTVLVVDDHDDSRIMVATLLSGEGYRVLTARNGEEALESIRQWRPCVILLDLTMPVMDGPELRRRLLQDPDTARIPVVLLTAAHDALQRAAQMSAAGVVQKPVALPRLLDLVSRHCGPISQA